MKTECTECAMNDSGDLRDYHGRCLGHCRECGDHLISDGRYTLYCPSCDVCQECGCELGGHHSGCSELDEEEPE